MGERGGGRWSCLRSSSSRIVTEGMWRLELQSRRAVLKYGLAVVVVSMGLAVALLLDHYNFIGVADPLFLFSIALTVWFAGPGPGLLAVVLSGLALTYFFIEPIYSLAIRPAEFPHFVIFLLFALLISRFVKSRDELTKEVAERTQQASLLDLTHDTIFVRDMSDVITYWNRGAQELYGLRPEEALGKHADRLLQTVFSMPLDEIRAELLRTGRWEGELDSKRADGTPVTVSSRWSLQRDARGRPVAILCTKNDITDRKRRDRDIRTLNENLEKRSSQLQASNQELEAFAYSVSHDLRAPLRHMVGYTELLQKGASSALDQKNRRYMTMILESAKRMGELIDDLLAFSRIGRAEARKTLFSLEQLVTDTVREAQPETVGRNITWTLGTFPDVYADRSMLRVALMNLLLNAVKFTRTREQAKIEMGCVDGKDDETVVFIRDNGVGFDMKYSNKLFGVFQRLHQKEAFEGTGIGLATVQRIVHRHGGRVWAEGAVDTGATFYFSVPKRMEI